MKRYIYIMFACVCAMLFASVTAQAQTTNIQSGDIITISNGSNYLAVNNAGNGIVNKTTVDEYCYWEVTITNSTYTFKSVKAGTYLRVNSSGSWNPTYTLALGNEQYFTEQDQKYYASVQGGWNNTTNRYICYDDGWTTSTSGNASSLILTLVKRVKKFTAVSPAAGYVKEISTITVTGNADMASVDASMIQLKNSNGADVAINVAINANQLIITPQTTPAPGTYTLTIEEGAVKAEGDDPFMAVEYSWVVDPNMTVAVIHVPGFYDALDNRGYQKVHTVERTMYYTGEEEVLQLLLAESNFFGYMRWYDYTTDRNITTSWVTAPRGAGGAFSELTDGNISWGWYGLNDTHLVRGDNSNNTPTIKPWADKKAHTVACDVSAYTNYDLYNPDGSVLKIQEPTLSYRQIFYFKPASEMADRIANLGDNFLEVYTYQAPHTQNVLLTTEYRYSTENGTHESELGYFVRNTDDELLRVGTDIEATWYLNGNAVNNPTYPTKDFFQVAAAAAGTKRTYELIVEANTSLGVTKDIRLAQFNVEFVNATTHGPSTDGINLTVGEKTYSVATQTAIENNFQVLAYNDFDFGQTGSGTGNNTQYVNTPLSWEQSTYGFYHDGMKDEGLRDQANDEYGIPYYGEYAFLTSPGTADWASGSARENFAMYVDGTSEPGLVASLQASNVVVCAQKQMYCSMWLRNPHDSGDSQPTFRCNIQGRNKDANNSYSAWENIGTFYIGSLPNNSNWRQVVFPITSQVEYNEVRVQLYNFGTGGNGNDFMLDDLTLFVDKTPMSTYQVEPSTLGTNTTLPYTMAVLRVNYADRMNEASLYYQIYNLTENGKEPMQLEDYLGTGKGTSGWVDVPKSDYTPTSNTFDTPQAFYEYLHTAAATSGEYFVNVDGVWVMYILHKIPKTPAAAGSPYPYEPTNYGVRMSYNVVADGAWDQIDADCTMDMLFAVTQSTSFELRNAITDAILDEFLHQSDNNCANSLYYLDVKITQDTDPEHEGGNESGLPYADWLKGIATDEVFANSAVLGDAAADDAFEKYYGYTRAQVTAAIQDLRAHNKIVADVAALTDADFTEGTNKTIIEHLCNNGFLELYRKTVSFYLGSAETARYWVFPIEGTAESAEGTKLHDTPEPMWVQVSSYDSQFSLRIFGYELPDQYSKSLPTVRVLKSKMTEEVVIEYENKTFDAGTTQQGDAYLFSTTDMQLSRALGTQVFQYNSTVDNDNHIITLTVPENVETEFAVGSEYVVAVTLRDEIGNATPETGNNGCPVGTWFFNILVVPDVVVWTGGEDAVWCDDANWKGYEENEATHHYAPIEGSGVVIPSDKAPKLTELVIEKAADHPCPLHLNFPLTPECGQIYFEAGATMENQHLLKHDRAFVDLVVPQGTWNSVAVPIAGVVSGDMFIPHKTTGEYQGESTESTEPFGVTGFNPEGSRLSTSAYAFWQSFFNKTVYMLNENGSKESAISTTTTEFAPTNSLEEALEVGAGHQLLGFGPDPNEENLTIRLPKPDTEYSYYHPNGAAATPTQINRGENAGKLIYNPDQAIALTGETSETQYVMFGNPTMAYIDMQKFLTANAAILQGAYYLMENDSWEAATALVQATVTDGYLAPMRSVMLELNNSATRTGATVTLKPEHLVASLPTAPAAAPRRAASTNDVQKMVIRADVDGTQAQCIVAANKVANDSYTLSEDALFFSSGVESGVSDVVATSPVNMYTLSERVPMMVDVRKNIDTIPLAMLVMESYQTEMMTLTFDLSADWDKDVYFCDSKTGAKTLIFDGMEIEVELSANHEARYFLEGPDKFEPGNDIWSSTENVKGEINVWAYSPDNGQLVVTSNDILKSVEVYDLSGRLVADKELELQYNSTSLSIPTGAYIIKAALRDNSVHTLSSLVK